MVRPSHVRDAIYDLLTASARHGWSIEEVLASLRDRGQRADFSSVFRALAHLERSGSIQRVELGDGKSRYEAHEEHHEHVRCESCGAVASVPGCSVVEAREAVEDLTRYRITGHQLLFFGLCPACSSEEQPWP